MSFGIMLNDTLACRQTEAMDQTTNLYLTTTLPPKQAAFIAALSLIRRIRFQLS